jgi:hypothetical protein
VVGTAPDVVVGAGVLQEPGDPRRVPAVDECGVGQRVLERCPARETVLQREGVLDVAQTGFRRRLGVGAFQPGATRGVAGAQGLSQRFASFFRFSRVVADVS